jgi:hypothetical protein
MIAFTVFRMIFPLWKKFKKMMSENLLNPEQEAYQRNRNVNLMLASFTMVSIALFVTLNKDHIIQNNDIIFSFLFSGLFLFFISSLLFNIGHRRIIPYVAENLHSMGILSLGIGLFYIALTIIVINTPNLELLFFLFPLTLMGVLSYEEYLNYKHHRDKPQNQNQNSSGIYFKR